MSTNAINSAVAQKISLSNLKSYADIDKLSKSSIKIWGDDVKTSEQQQKAYTQYSENLT